MIKAKEPRVYEVEVNLKKRYYIELSPEEFNSFPTHYKARSHAEKIALDKYNYELGNPEESIPESKCISEVLNNAIIYKHETAKVYRESQVFDAMVEGAAITSPEFNPDKYDYDIDAMLPKIMEHFKLWLQTPEAQPFLTLN